ncbi:SET domain-containing protein [Sediminibacterium roseum]|uniref:SET domain-containing protein n=1 Tax=Sediminibacterium roseum TaxID=1978412 RepID=A0ABW9ZY79_9BACT|nr:SET domain-containing protein-lysine N-methyltransferase [Sediminibacterium roseum]NCI52126.1 SET domain-containing protein [Sediminibacterium roseum]
MISAVTSAYRMVSKHGFAEIMQNSVTGEKSLHAAAFFDAGDVVTGFIADRILDVPTYLTVQTGTSKHITLLPDFLQFVNHSCDPNVFFDTTHMELVALKEIQPGDELVFFYPSSEWEMTQPFECLCGSTRCLHRVQGAAFLSEEEAMRYRLTDFIREQLLNRKTI